MFLNQTTFVG